MLTIRTRKPADVQAVYEVLQASFLKSQATPESIATSGSVIYVAELDGKIVGTISVTVTKTFTYFDDLAVLPEYRKQGIATKLVEAAIRIANDNSDEMYAVCASPYSARIFKHLGFLKEDAGRYSKKTLDK